MMSMLRSAGIIDISAKWGGSANRADHVTYRIHHAGGSSDRQVNQQQPSAGWYHLGMYTMSPGQNHRVEVYGALEGETVADAMRFVSSGVSAPGINYVHADHLGSPQKMTDSAKAIVWDAVYTPFGQVHAISGTATNHQRFPGQYADAETGYSYNYFRDYDPTTGRYVQSDPVGLRAGLNTYGYVGGNPIKKIDRYGLYHDSSGSCCQQSFLECLNNCIKKYDPLGNSEKAGLTAAGGTFPKSFVGVGQGLGGASRFTTIPSAIAYGFGGGGTGTIGGALRALGRVVSPIWIGYGVYLFGMEVYCSGNCAGNNCAY